MAGGVLLQSAATTGNGNEWNCRGIGGLYRLSVIGAGTITDGAVQWEHAPTSGYTGTWAPLGPPVEPLSTVIQEQTHEGALNFVRARISTTVTGSGGSVTVRMQPPVNWES